MNRNQALQRPSTPLPRSAAGRRDRLPADNDDHGARRRKMVGRDLTVEGLRPNTGCSDYEERARVAHRARPGRMNPLPARRYDDPNPMRRDDPPPTAAPRCKRREYERSKNERTEAHLHVYEPQTTSGPRPSPEFHIKPLVTRTSRRSGEQSLVGCRGGRGLLGAQLGGLSERGSEGHFLQQPREHEGHRRHRHAPQEDAVERMREGLEEVGVDRGGQVPRLRRVQVDAAAEAGCDAPREVRQLAGEPAREDRPEDGDAEGAADRAEEGRGRGGDAYF